MSLLKKGLSVLVLLSLVLFISCEEEGDPLTLDDIYEAQEGSRLPFKVFVNGREFVAENPTGEKDGNDFLISGSNSTGTINIRLSDYLPATYSGENNEVNQITYTDMYGKKYISNREDQKSDAETTIRFYDEFTSIISGRFSAALYDSDYEKPNIYLSAGVFNELFVNIPFMGRMGATVSGGEVFKSENCSYSSIDNGGGFFDRIIATSVNDSMRISFEIQGKLKNGQYQINDSTFIVTYNGNVFGSISENRYLGKSGIVTIASVNTINKRVKGSFNFQAVNGQQDTLKISAGSFNALIN